MKLFEIEYCDNCDNIANCNVLIVELIYLNKKLKEYNKKIMLKITMCEVNFCGLNLHIKEDQSPISR